MKKCNICNMEIGYSEIKWLNVDGTYNCKKCREKVSDNKKLNFEDYDNSELNIVTIEKGKYPFEDIIKKIKNKTMEKEDFLKKIKENLQDMYSIAKKKNADYSKGTAFQNFELVESLGITSVEKGLLVRMADKMSRISTLIDQEALVKDEAIEDTLLDLANYAIILKIYLTNKNKNDKNRLLK